MAIVLPSLPLVAFALVWVIFRWHGSGWRRAFLCAATSWGVLVAALTELLSLPSWLTRLGVAAVWLAIALAAAGYLAFRIQQQKMRRSGGVRQFARSVACQVEGLGEADGALLAGVSIVLGLVGLVALASPPNTWDAMEYHLPRIVRWIEDQSIAFFPTHELKQLHMPPWAEYAMLQFHLLARSDRLDNLVQWFSMAGSIIAVSEIARFLGADRRGQVIAAVFCASIPEGILEASGTINDYVLSFWVAASAYFFLAHTRSPSRLNAVGFGAALGLACLTKGTAFVLAGSTFAVWFLLSPRCSKVPMLRAAPLIAVVALSLNAGHFYRNFDLYRSPLGPASEADDGQFKYANDYVTPGSVVANIARNVALHLGTPNADLNASIQSDLTQVAQLTVGDVNAPGLTWTTTSFAVKQPILHEAVAGNPFHLLLIVTSTAVTLPLLFRRPDGLAVYAFGLAVAFIAFCAVFRWQPWHTRLHLPLFVLWAAPVGVLLARVWPRWAGSAVGMALLLLAMPAAYGNQLRPLLFAGDSGVLEANRLAQYFADNRGLADSYGKAAAAATSGCGEIGLDLTAQRYEYPLLALLGATDGTKRMDYVAVGNPSSRYQRPEKVGHPCAVICLLCADRRGTWDTYFAGGLRASVFGDVVVFGREGEVKDSAALQKRLGK